MRYLDTLSNKVKNYFNVLEPNIPDWLDEYIESKNLQKQKICKCVKWNDIHKNG